MPDVNKTGYFDDLVGVDWAVEAINSLYEKSVINGKSDKVFDPNAYVTRSEFVKMIVLALGFQSQGYDCDFADLTPDMWQYPYISTAHNFGIVNGYADGSFGVNDYISRQDMAVIVERALIAYGFEFSGESVEFNDNGLIAEYAENAVGNLAGMGIITGMPNGTFEPLSNVTRAQAACVIYRAAKK